MDKVRWGLLSTANINRKLIPAIRSSKRGELVAVASRNQSHASSYADHWSIPYAFGSYQSMLDSGKIDAVYISLPNHLHAEWSIKALQAGVHVLCEKPLAISLVEVDKMIDASHRSGKCLAEAFMYLHHPQTRITLDWVKSGRLGEILLVRSVFNFQITDPNDIRLIPEFGGGSLWDVGVYPISLSQCIYGTPPITVYGQQILSESGVDGQFYGQMQFPKSGVAQLSCSFSSPFHTSAEVIGSKGRLSLTRPFNMFDQNRRLTYHGENGEKQVIKVPSRELYLGEVEDIHDVVLLNAAPSLSFAESRNHIRTVLALYDSARKGQPVYLDQF